MPDRPLGKHQRDLLALLGGVGMRLIVPDAQSRALAARGLMAAEPDGSFARVTAKGLRALADEIDAGRVLVPGAPESERDG